MREIPLKSLTLPAGFGGLLASADARAKASALKKCGGFPPVLPAVLEEDMTIIAGEVWVAAAMKLGQQSLACQVIEATPGELQTVRRLFRVHRENKRSAKQVRQEVDAIKREIMAVDPWIPETGHGRATANSKAIRQYAEQHGLQVSTVHSMLWQNREAKRSAHGPFVTWGIDVEEDWLEHVEIARKSLAHIEGKLRAVRKLLSELHSSEAVYHRPRLERLIEEASELRQKVADAFPVALCAHCKGVEGIQENCLQCKGVGLLCQGEKDAVPARLQDTTYPVVLVDGIERPVEELL